MSVRSGQSITVEFTLRNFSTGAAQNGDSLPTGTLVLNGVDNGATVTVTNVATGRYKAQVTLPTLAVSDWVELNINATVNSITDNGIIWRDTKDFFAGCIPDVVAGGAGGIFIAATNAATTINGLTLAGVNASGATPATAGFTVTGGAASTTSGGVAAPAIKATGGSGAASTNGAAAGATFAGGGTTTVSGADGITATGSNNGGNGLNLSGGTSGSGLLVSNGGVFLNSNGPGLECSSSGGSGYGIWAISSVSGAPGALFQGGTNSAGVQFNGTGNGAGALFSGGLTGHGISATGGSGAGDGLHLNSPAGAGAYDINLAGSGTIHGTLTGSVTVGGYSAGQDPATLVLDGAGSVEGGGVPVTVRQALRGILASCCNKTNGAGTTAFNIRDTNDTKNRVAATTDASGNRTAVTLNLT